MNLHVRSINYKYGTQISEVGYHKVVADKVGNYTRKNGSVLEIGSGTGNIIRLIKHQRPDLYLTAADVSATYMSHITENIPDVRTLLISEDGDQLDSLAGEYDTVVMCHCLEHMRNPPDAIARALKLMKQAGYLILAVPNPVRPNVFWGNILKRHYVPKGHVYSWDRSHWINFLEQVLNLKVVEYPTDEVRFLPKPILRRFRGAERLEWLVAKQIPWWSFSNMAVVRKTV